MEKIKILIVAADKGKSLSSFVEEQIAVLESIGVQIVRYGVTGKGILGYLRELPALRRMIRKECPNIIHAHYGFCGLLANLQRDVPVVTTYHGSDINVPRNLKFSKISEYLSIHNIFVSYRSVTIVHPKKRFTILPCGINLTDDQLLSRIEARKLLGLHEKEILILFAGSFENAVKDAPLAKASVEELRQRMVYSVEHIETKNCEVESSASRLALHELRGFTRAEVNCWMCAVNCLLMTSKTEGSPQVVKEAMACGCPIVSVDVGDVAERTSGVEGCYVVHTREPKDIAEAMHKAIAFEGKTKGREKILEMGLSNEQVAKTIKTIYESILS